MLRNYSERHLLRCWTHWQGSSAVINREASLSGTVCFCLSVCSVWCKQAAVLIFHTSNLHFQTWLCSEYKCPLLPPPCVCVCVCVVVVCVCAHVSVVRRQPVPDTRVNLSVVCEITCASGVVAVLLTNNRNICCCCCCCREKRKVFWSCCPPIRKSLVLHHPPLPRWRQSRLLLERRCMVRWALTPPLPLAPSAASSLNLLLLLLSLPPLHPPPPRRQSPPIGRAAPSMDVHPSLLLLASRAPLSYLNSMTRGPSSVRGTLTCVTSSGIDLLICPVHRWCNTISQVLWVISCHCCRVYQSLTGCAPQVQGGGVISSPEWGRAGTKGGRHCVRSQEEGGRLVQRHAAEERQDWTVPWQLCRQHLTHMLQWTAVLTTTFSWPQLTSRRRGSVWTRWISTWTVEGTPNSSELNKALITEEESTSGTRESCRERDMMSLKAQWTEPEESTLLKNFSFLLVIYIFVMIQLLMCALYCSSLYCT